MRDLLPPEAERRRKLSLRLLDHFALHGFELVTPPAFELAEVLERGLGALDPHDVLRFVEPESGEVAALRPDVTPQIARMAATRLSDRPGPMRLCYEGTVLRRRQERARKHRQIPQSGVELLGMGGPEGDVELMALAASAVRSTGLTSFMLDLGHADIARALLPACSAPLGSAILDALAHKDSARLRELVGQTRASSEISDALCRLPELHGDGGIWKEATRLLGSTAAAPALLALRDLWDRAAMAGLESVLRVDLGEVRGFAYYTGAIFHLLAEGPGEPIGSGGRYDDLLGRFGAPMPAAGFALDLDNLSWALRAQGAEAPREPRVLVVSSPRSLALCESLRKFGVGCVISRETDPEGYARAWGFSHVLREQSPSGVDLLTLSSNLRQTLGGASPRGSAPDGAETALASQLAEVVRNG